MLPTKSNTAEQGCAPVSSNCVVWQGPALPCLNLCNGDTVSDVVYKVANDLCTIKDELDLTDLDLTCLVSFCSSTNPAPTTKTLSAVLDFIVRKVCCLNTTVAGITPGTSYTEPNLALPTCLQYQNNQGQTVTQLQHSQYSLTLAQKICQLNTTVSQHTSQISNHNTRITALENAPGVTLPQVTPNCILPSTPTAIVTVLDELENQYCLLRNVLGTNSALTAAVAQQCANLGAQPALSQAGNLSSLQGWNSTFTNLAQSFQNLWITVCDMRAAINDLKNCCSQVDCSQFILGYTASANNLRQEVYLDFNPGTIIPAGFANCSQLGSLVTISDGVNSKDFRVDLVTLASSTNTFTAAVAGSGVTGVTLNTSLPYTVTVNGCIVKDGKTCEKSVVRTISVPCPIVSNVTANLV
jgi:hypothetical protein